MIQRLLTSAVAVFAIACAGRAEDDPRIFRVELDGRGILTQGGARLDARRLDEALEAATKRLPDSGRSTTDLRIRIVCDAETPYWAFRWIFDAAEYARAWDFRITIGAEYVVFGLPKEKGLRDPAAKPSESMRVHFCSTGDVAGHAKDWPGHVTDLQAQETAGEAWIWIEGDAGRAVEADPEAIARAGKEMLKSAKALEIAVDPNVAMKHVFAIVAELNGGTRYKTADEEEALKGGEGLQTEYPAPFTFAVPAAAATPWDREIGAARVGLTALKKLQKEDGSWGDHHPVAVTAICGMAILAVREDPLRDDALWRGWKWLEAHQKRGVWECESRQWVHTQSFAVMFLAELVRQSGAPGSTLGLQPIEDLEALLQKGVDALQRSQGREGGWTYESNFTKGTLDASNSSCAVVALAAARGAGAEVARVAMERAAQFLRRLQHPDGSFSYTDGGKESMEAGSAGALAAAAATSAIDLKSLEKGIAFLDGCGWRKLSGGAHPEYACFFGMVAARGIRDDKGVETEAAAKMERDICDELLRLQVKGGLWTPSNPELDPSRSYSTGMAVLTLGLRRGKLGLVAPPEAKDDK